MESIIEYSLLVDTSNSELIPSFLAAMPIAGTVLAIGIGYKLFRHFVK